MIYKVDCFVADFAMRTQNNLQHIDDGACIETEKDIKDKTFFEVTQLINSLLGLAVIPIEIYKSKKDIFNDEELERISKSAYDKIVHIINKCETNKNLYSDYQYDYKDQNEKKSLKVTSFLRHIRNSIAHGGNEGLHFFPVEKNSEITNIFFYDNYTHYKKNVDRKKNEIEEIEEFCVNLSIGDVRELVLAISDLFSCIEEKYPKSKLNGDFAKKENALRKLLKHGRIDKSKATITIHNMR